ncbi:MAG: 50S ribosomal protein L18 [Chitinophagia bacterium]|jgi:large subunit ribosomal protein L18
MSKLAQRQKIRYRIRKKVQGTSAKPRLSVFRSNADIYCQLIDDVNGVTLAASSSREADIEAQKVPKIDKAKLAGESVAKKALALNITTCVFDRGGNLYHGRIKAVAEGARAGGLQF